MEHGMHLRAPGYSLGFDTWIRAAELMSRPGLKLYEIGHILSATAPQSPFAEPVTIEFKPSAGVPGTIHLHNGDRLGGGVSQQGTHLDAPGHFGALPAPWDGKSEFPADTGRYLGKRPQAMIKPDPSRGLQELGIDQVPPLITSAVILDATASRGGEALSAGDVISRADMQEMIRTAFLDARRLLPGDALLIHTGWGKRWSDPDNGSYYASGPGLAADAAEWIAGSGVSIVGLDNPFTDPVADGQLLGRTELSAGVSREAPFAIHHINLVEAGVLQIQNLFLSDVVAAGVTLAAFLALPIRIKAAAGSPIRPVLLGSST